MARNGLSPANRFESSLWWRPAAESSISRMKRRFYAPAHLRCIPSFLLPFAMYEEILVSHGQQSLASPYAFFVLSWYRWYIVDKRHRASQHCCLCFHLYVITLHITFESAWEKEWKIRRTVLCVPFSACSIRLVMLRDNVIDSNILSASLWRYNYNSLILIYI